MILGYSVMTHLSREIAYILNANFFQFCVSCTDDNGTYISIIPAQFDGEWYAIGRSNINRGTGIFGDDTFIARNRLYTQCKFFSNFALAVLMTIEHIFPLFQRSFMENSTPKLDQI